MCTQQTVMPTQGQDLSLERSAPDPHEPRQEDHGESRIVIIGSGLAALSAALFLEQEQQRRQDDANSELRGRPSHHPCAQEESSSDRGPQESTAATTASDRRRPRTLPSRRWTVTLYERDASYEERRDGYGLTLKYDPQSVLAKLGVLEELCRFDCPSRSHYVLDKDGHVTGYYGNAFVEAITETSHGGDGVAADAAGAAASRGYGQRGNLRVPRQLVRQSLIRRLRTTRIEWGHRLVSLEAVPGHDDDDDTARECACPTTSLFSGRPRTNRSNTRIRCHFDNGVTVLADWVLGADGIRSTVVQQHSALLSAHLAARRQVGSAASTLVPTAPPLHKLHIRLVVGLSELDEHAVKDPKNRCLLDERGFYTFGDAARLFVMPYSAPTPLKPNESRRYMWQLSFRERERRGGDDEDSATATHRNGDPRQLLDEAKAVCRNWHEPIPLLLLSTPLDTVWSAPLYDRDPHELLRHWETLRRHHSRMDRSHALVALDRPLPILVLGDALHAMSCFKGQGAHQALKDGPCVSKWIAQHLDGRCSAESAVTNCHRELVQRTRSVVLDSRRAARELHGTASSQLVDPAAFAGVSDPHRAAELLEELRRRDVRAGTTADLETAIAQVLRELPPESSDCRRPTAAGATLRPTAADATPQPPVAPWTHAALEAARTGRLAELRRLSWIAKDARWVPAAADDEGNTLLHLAAAASLPSSSSSIVAPLVAPEAFKEDRLETIQWLVREAGCSCRVLNLHGQPPVDLVAQGDAKGVALLRALEDHQQQRMEDK